MNEKINLDIQSILDKQFQIDFKGYNPSDVDAFIDLMIKDYQSYQNIIGNLNQKNRELEQNNASLRARMIELEGKLRAKEAVQNPSVLGASNVDMLKRLSRLEEQVITLTESINHDSKKSS